MRSPRPLGGAVKLGEIKSEERAVVKIVFDYRGDASQLKDLLRGTIVAQDREHAHRIAQHIAAHFDISAGKARNLWAPGAAALPKTGYRDAKFNIRIAGMPAEVQVSTKAMIKAKNQAHPLMKRVSEIERKIANEGCLATDEEKAEIADLQSSQRAIFAQAA